PSVARAAPGPRAARRSPARRGGPTHRAAGARRSPPAQAPRRAAGARQGPAARSREAHARPAHQVREQPPRARHAGRHLAEERVAAIDELAAPVLRVEEPAIARGLARVVAP